MRTLQITDRGLFWPLFHLLTRESLTLSFGGGAPRFSGICADGIPWQFCIPLGTTATAELRYLTEIGIPGTSMTSRVELTRERLSEAIDLLQIVPIGGQLIDALFATLPSEGAGLDGLTGSIWVGIGVGRSGEPGIRVYANLEWGDDLDRWRRLTEALRQMHAPGFARLLRASVGELTSAFSPAGLAASLQRRPSLKLYLRPKADPWDACRLLVRRADLRLPEGILTEVERAIGVPLAHASSRSLILSIGGSVDGTMPEMKLDLNATHLFDDERRREVAVEALAAALSISATRYRQSMAALRVAAPPGYAMVHDFIGVGGGPQGLRLNVYVRAPAPLSSDSLSAGVSSSVRRDEVNHE